MEPQKEGELHYYIEPSVFIGEEEIELECLETTVVREAAKEETAPASKEVLEAEAESTKEQEINVKAQKEAQAASQAAAQQEYVPEYTAPSDYGSIEVASPQDTGGGCLGGVEINKTGKVLFFFLPS